MTKTKKRIKPEQGWGWGLQNPEGDIIEAVSVSYVGGRNNAIAHFTGVMDDWKYLYRIGYRCVEVKAVEVKR